MRNKITIDAEKESGYDCECIISEGDGNNTLELYFWNVGRNPSIELSWVKGGGSGDESRYDVNGDGKITHDDAVEILQAAMKGIYDYKYDIDLDGYVTAKDALIVEKKAQGIVDPEESGSAVVEGIFLDNGDYYYSIPLEYISGYREVTVKVKWSGFESKPIYFNCINIDENTDFIVTRNLSRDDTYTVIAATDETIQIATKDILGVVKIGDGINVNESGVISVPIATKDIAGAVKIGNGLTIDENGELSLNQFGGNVILIDHAPTESDLTRTNAVLIQYNKEDKILGDSKSSLFSVVATFAEITNEYEFDYTGIFGFYDMSSLDLANASWNNKISSNYNISLIGGSAENDCLHLTSSDYGKLTCDEPMTIYALFKTNSSSGYMSIISKHMTTTNQYHDFAIVTNPNIVLSCRQSIVRSTVDARTSHVVCITRSTTSAKLYIDGVYIGSTTTALGNYYGEYMLNKSIRGSYIGDVPGDHLYRAVAFGSEEHNETQILNSSNYLLNVYGVIT